MKAPTVALAGLFAVVLFGACAGPPGPGYGGCLGNGAPCQGFAQCCSGNCNNGACVGGGNGCHGAGAPCNGNGECCTNICAGGACLSCFTQGSGCSDNPNCCSQDCQHGICN
jgi:hypothetical protein